MFLARGMGETMSRLGPSLPRGVGDTAYGGFGPYVIGDRRDGDEDGDEDAALLVDAPTDGMLVPGFQTPLPTTYGRDIGVAIRVADGAAAPRFANDLAVGAQLFFHRACGPFGGVGHGFWDTGVAFVLPAYLTAYIHGPLVEAKFLDPDDRRPVVLTPSLAAAELLDGKDPTRAETVVAQVVFMPIVRPDFLVDPPASTEEIQIVPQAEVVIADEPQS